MADYNDEPKDLSLQIDGLDFRRVYKAVHTSYEKMAWVRNSVHNLVKEFAGPAYGGCKGPDKPLNKMNQLIESYVMLTAANRPAVEIAPKPGKGAYKGFARLWQDTTNNLAQEIKLEETLLAAIQDAFFSIGVVKVHRDNYRPLPIGDTMVDPGIPSASVVPIDDWVFDTSAKKWSQIKYCGDKYRVAFSDVVAGAESGKYDPSVVKLLKPTSKSAQDGDKLERISTGEVTDDDELEPMIDLADIWIAKTGKIYTCALSDPNTFKLKNIPPLGAIEWKDPDNPPHHILRFSEVPHNILPVAPASHLDVLDRSINNVARKEIADVQNQKTVYVYRPQGEETMKRVTKAGNGVAVMGSPEDVTAIKTGGVDANMHQMLLALNEFFNTQSGNLETIAGLGSSAETLGQEQIIANASNRKVGTLQNKVAAFTAGLFRSLGYLLWEDKILEMATEIEAGGFVATDTWKPYEREGNFLDYNFNINAHNLPYSPPAAQAQLLMSIVERIFLPMQEMMMAQGGQVDFADLASTLATLLNLPAINDIIKFTAAPEGSEGTPATTSTKPSSTYRNYTRQSLPSQGTAQSRLAQTLTGMQEASNQVPVQGAA